MDLEIIRLIVNNELSEECIGLRTLFYYLCMYLYCIGTFTFWVEVGIQKPKFLKMYISNSYMDPEETVTVFGLFSERRGPVYQ